MGAVLEKGNDGVSVSSSASSLGVARRVIETEIKGLQELLEALDSEFERAVDAIDAMKEDRKGRVIVTGIGKSGHVARKITATMASTGTPSHFVHSGEASHGDLGMITGDDVVLMISNSGENAELSDLIAYTRRFGITLIGMTSNPDSSLARHSDIRLILPKSPEACLHGLAPTTSTTMAMAMGDALAVALLDRMGLTAEQFGVFHPGGKLGQRLSSVSDIMCGRDELAIVGENANMGEAIVVLSEKNVGCVLIVDEQGDLKGIITDGDLKRHMGDDLLSKPVVEVMNENPKTISENALAVEALNIMTKTKGKYLTSLVAVDEDGRFSGLIRLQDCLRAGVE